MSEAKRRLAGIVAADVVGYSAMVGADEPGTLARVRALRTDVIEPLVAAHEGRLFKATGDGFFAEFASAVQALRCAIAIQDMLRAQTDRLRLRIGVHQGEVVPEGDDLMGDGVIIAARLEPLAKPGGICISSRVREDAAGKMVLEVDDLGTPALKNIVTRIQVFRVRLGAAERSALPLPELSIAKAPSLSLVVLPLANVGGNANEDYLANAITEDLTTDLSCVPGALVIAHHSAATYKDKPLDVRRIGEELGVRYVVRGSVRKLGDMLRVNVQLISTETNAHLWAGRFDQNVQDLGIGQEEIVSRLTAVLGVQMLDAESARGTRNRPNDADAFDLLLRARAARRKMHSAEQLSQIAALFEKVLQSDPSLVRAMCGLADILIDQFVIPDYPDRGNEGLIERAATLIASASAIEPNGEQVIFSQGALLRAQGRWAEAISIFQRLLDLYPNTVAAYRLLGFLQLAVGQAEQAIPLLQRSIRVDPLSIYNRASYSRIGISLLLLGRDEESIEWQQRALAAGAMAPPAWRAQCYLFMASAFALIGRPADAQRTLAEANRLWPFATVRSLLPTMTPRGLPDPAYLAQMRRVQEGLRLAGLRDHADEEADFGVASDGVLHTELAGWTPTAVPGATTIRTSELVSLLASQKPTLIDVALDSWGRSIPDAIGLQGTGHGGTFSDKVQSRLHRKMRDLTNGDLSVPTVVFCVNSERFTACNLALRLVALGYNNIYWYRGGFEAWQLNGLPESDLVLQDW